MNFPSELQVNYSITLNIVLDSNDTGAGSSAWHERRLRMLRRKRRKPRVQIPPGPPFVYVLTETESIVFVSCPRNRHALPNLE